MKNRRIALVQWEDGTWQIKCKKLGENRREIMETSMRLSDEAMQHVANMYLQFR